MPVEPPEWTEVELTSHRGAVGQRIIAAMLVVVGLVGVVLSILAVPDWWVVVSVFLVSVFLGIVGLSLWFHVGMSAAATVELVRVGAPTALRVLRSEEIADESIVFRLFLRLPEEELVVVQHQCSQGQCVEAGRAAPHSEVPAILDPVTKSWGVVHGRLDV